MKKPSTEVTYSEIFIDLNVPGEHLTLKKKGALSAPAAASLHGSSNVKRQPRNEAVAADVVVICQWSPFYLQCAIVQLTTPSQLRDFGLGMPTLPR